MALSVQQLPSYLPEIRGLLQDWKTSQSKQTQANSAGSDPTASSDVIVAFRTRPILPEEMTSDLAQTELNDASDELNGSNICIGISVKHLEPGVTVAHVPNLKWKGGITLTHKEFKSDLAFGPESSNEDVYGTTVEARGMIPLVISGGVVSILAYGQTGTGKTYSMTFLELAIARDLFRHAAKVGSDMKAQVSSKTSSLSSTSLETDFTYSKGGGDGDGSEAFEITANCLEITGKAVYDLAVDNGEKKPLVIGEDKLGKVRPKLVTVRVNSPEELEEFISKCLSYRRTAATARNATSSRSHAILTIRVKNILIPQLEDGEFILVDLAGSERYEDSKAHSKQLMDESRENNKALLALKECVRARAKAGSEDGFVHIPFRSSRLTWVLKPLFDMEETRATKAVVIAHVSPHIQDVSHSVNTLSYAAPFRILPARRPPAKFNTGDPRTWDHEATMKWLHTTFAKQQQIHRQSLIEYEKLCPSPHGGIYLARLYGGDWVQLCLQNRKFKSLEKREEEGLVAAIKEDSLNLYLTFSQMLLYARTKTRKAVMNNRNPIDYEAGSDRRMVLDPIEQLSEDDRVDFYSLYLQPEIYKKVQERKAVLGDWKFDKQVRNEVYEELIMSWREQRAREKIEKEEQERSEKEVFERYEDSVDFVDSGF
ncbi:P-loop containing nucleoside triphosphate hydrolase protein [Hysterangium stoloniferum]|nr:P-loop containing nucleoside triphosphate hydrolase protein [Hysterangium stoloniferum]